jgi:L-alanine-DL-glutamate epimerase-like enolase superfamily enzyme
VKIQSIESLHCDAGWRYFSFLKITTACGIVGWGEYNACFGSRGLPQVIDALAPLAIGHDPRASEAIVAHLHVMTRQSRGGLNQQAIAAIENALMDIRGKEAGKPVAALFGGPVRDRIPVYWSHFATYRAGYNESMGLPPVTTYDAVAKHAAEVKAAGFTAMKTNILRVVDGGLTYFNPGFGRTPGHPELNWDQTTQKWVRDQLRVIRDAVGDTFGLMLDINFHFKTEGFMRIAHAVAPFELTWLEIDTHDPVSLAAIRRRAPCPIASCETLHGRREFKPYLEQYATDVAIVDVPWNGIGESIKIAAMADAFEVNVAPHNFYGHLSSAQCAHFCASVPNFRIMEIDIDAVPWRDEMVDRPPVIQDGAMLLPTGPGWGMEPNEAFIRAHPPKG